MPNQANRSKDQSNIVKKKKSPTVLGAPKKGTASAAKHSRSDDGQSAAGSASKGGSKTISDGSTND